MTLHSCLYSLDVLTAKPIHIYHFHIFLLSLPSHLHYLELSSRSSFPRCPQFPPFHAFPAVGSWGMRNACAVLVWAAVCPPFPGWLQVSWHTEHCSPGCACIQVAEGISPSLAHENFHSTWYFWISYSLSKLKFSWWSQEVCWRKDGTVCSCKPHFPTKSGWKESAVNMNVWKQAETLCMSCLIPLDSVWVKAN